jgi:hypothetical protein
MTRLLTLAIVVLVASQPSARRAAVISGDTRWVRGTVSASSPKTLSVTAGDRCLVLKMDASTEIVGGAEVPAAAARAPIPVGTLVQAHFVAPEGKLAAVVVDNTTASTSSQPSRREGTSVRGEVQRLESGSLTLRVAGGSRDVVVDDRTTLLDRNGPVRATGLKAIAPLLASGSDVLVTWVPFVVMNSERGSSTWHRRAQEIRTLKRTPASTLSRGR